MGDELEPKSDAGQNLERRKPFFSRWDEKAFKFEPKGAILFTNAFPDVSEEIPDNVKASLRSLILPALIEEGDYEVPLNYLLASLIKRDDRTTLEWLSGVITEGDESIFFRKSEDVRILKKGSVLSLYHEFVFDHEEQLGQISPDSNFPETLAMLLAMAFLPQGRNK
jgi:hypothetical protein